MPKKTMVPTIILKYYTTLQVMRRGLSEGNSSQIYISQIYLCVAREELNTELDSVHF